MSVWKTMERRVRPGLARALLLAFASEPDPPERIELGEIRRVLFVRPNFRMGNLLLTTPALSAARRALPEAEIGLLTTSTYGDLLRGHPGVDRVVTLDRMMFLLPWSLLGLARLLRQPRYDLVVDCSEGESLTGALLARLSGGRWRVAPGSSRYRGLFNVHVRRDPDRLHRIERLLHLLESIGIVGDSPEMSIALAASERDWAEARWREWDLFGGSPVVGVNIGARTDKRWPMKDFVRVIRRLREEREVRVVVFAGPEDLDRLSIVEDRLPEDVVVDTTDEVRRFASLLERCTAVITGDTGPMHLSAAMGTPTVSIFLKDNHGIFAPLGERHRCVHDSNGDVSPEEILHAVSAILDRIGR